MAREPLGPLVRLIQRGFPGAVEVSPSLTPLGVRTWLALAVEREAEREKLAPQGPQEEPAVPDAPIPHPESPEEHRRPQERSGGILEELAAATQAMVDHVVANRPADLTDRNGTTKPGWARLFAALEAAQAVIKSEAPIEPGSTPVDTRKMARRSDPGTSKVAAERVAPALHSRQEEVLTRLRRAEGGWVDGDDMARPDCGGSEGKRRLRELREELGWPIEARPHPERATSWQYRLPPGLDVA